MSALESCLFTLSLDDYTEAPSKGNRTPSSEIDLHIKNISAGRDGMNRWFDKSLTLIVESNARFGVMGEHSPVDALIPSMIADWVVSQSIDPCAFAPSQKDTHTPQWERLNWAGSLHILEECADAKDRANTLSTDSDASVLWYTSHGIKWIKEQG